MFNVRRTATASITDPPPQPQTTVISICFDSESLWIIAARKGTRRHSPRELWAEELLTAACKPPAPTASSIYLSIYGPNAHPMHAKHIAVIQLTRPHAHPLQYVCRVSLGAWNLHPEMNPGWNLHIKDRSVCDTADAACSSSRPLMDGESHYAKWAAQGETESWREMATEMEDEVGKAHFSHHSTSEHKEDLMLLCTQVLPVLGQLSVLIWTLL